MKDPNQRESVNPITGRLSVETVNKEKSMTQQQFKDECDINNIMQKYVTTGEFSHATKKQGVYADFSGIRDYQQMVETVMYAQEAFDLLPAKVRSRFRNDPGELLAFLQDPNNKEEARSLGLLADNAVPAASMANNDAIQRDDKTPISADTAQKTPLEKSV